MPPGEYVSITVHEDVLERLEEYRTEEQSMSAAIDSLLDNAKATEPDEIADRLKRLEESVQRIPERTADDLEHRFG